MNTNWKASNFRKIGGCGGSGGVAGNEDTF